MTRARLLAVLREGAPLLLLLGALAARSLDISRRHLVPVYDEIGYMADIREAGRRGAPGTVACYARGECREDNRNPLYVMLAAATARQEPGDFAAAKLVTLGTAALLVLAVYAFGRRVWGPSVAVAAAAVPALSWNAAVLSQEVLADVLYAALFFAALATLLAGLERRAGWLAFGVLAGLAYLAKASGHFLLLAAAAVAVERARRGRPWLPELACALAGFAAGAWFVLVRNVRVWGSPFYTIASKVVWLDSWDQVWLLQARPDRWSRVGPASYFRTHGLSDVLERFSAGFGAVSNFLVTMFDAQPFGWGVGFFGAPLLAASFYGLWLRWRGGRREEVLAVCGAVVPLFLAHCWGYSAGIKGERFVLPLVVVLAPYAALGAARAWRAAWAQTGLPERARVWALPAALSAAAVVAAAGASMGLGVDPLSLWAIPPNWQDAGQWISEHVPPRRIVTSSDTGFSIWNLPEGISFDCPFRVFDEDLRACVDGYDASFLLLDRADPTFDQWPARLGPSDAYGPRTFLGWPRVYHDPLRPSQFSVYARPAAR